MANQIPRDILAAIEEAVRLHPDGVSARRLMQALGGAKPLRTLQYQLKSLVDGRRLVMDGKGRWARYRLAPAASQDAGAAERVEDDHRPIPISQAGMAIRNYVQRSPSARSAVGYYRAFLDNYRPNVRFYLTTQERAQLAIVGSPPIAGQPAGTYARQILGGLLPDLAWNSCRLEGAACSLFDAKRLIELGEGAERLPPLEAQMVLNHKDAIEFLVGAPDDIGFDRRTILNLHALLANNLMGDPAAAGRLRRAAVGGGRPVFHPLDAVFDQVLATAEAIADPFEQAFFIMVQLPYLQPFDDVNNEVSRLAANIPLIRSNLAPLSFADVPRDVYMDAVLGVNELVRIELLKDVFLWAYGRSAARHAAVRHSTGQPDPIRLRYRETFRDLIATLILDRVGRRQAAGRIAAWAGEAVDPDDRPRFVERAEAELTALHEGNFARYRVRPAEFAAWRAAWDAR